MTQSEYRISLYRHDWLDKVVDLLRFLLGEDRDINLFYFKWKYYDNPHAEEPLGVVALHGEEVVGFRGYFSSRWSLHSGTQEVAVLLPGDTCVHPDHRLKGLSLAMGDKAMESYHSNYRFFLNMSAGSNSVPGYLKMGFYPVVAKRYISRYSLPGMARFFLCRRRRERFPPETISPGTYGDVEVSLSPKIEEMVALSAPLPNLRVTPRLSLCKDQAYFRWRYGNKRNRYLFYFSFSDGLPLAYIAMRIHKNNRRAYIVDYGARKAQALGTILHYVTRERSFDIISIYDFGIEKAFLDLLTSCSFRTTGPLRLLERKRVGDWPVLVRPIKAHCTERDWFIDGMDIRKITSWELREISSDGA